MGCCTSPACSVDFCLCSFHPDSLSHLCCVMQLLGLVLNFPKTRILGIAERGERLLRLGVNPPVAGWMVMGQSCCPHASIAVWPPHILVIRCCLTKPLCWSWAPELVQGRICYNLCENIGVWLPCSPGCDMLDAARAAEAFFSAEGAPAYPAWPHSPGPATLPVPARGQHTCLAPSALCRVGFLQPCCWWHVSAVPLCRAMDLHVQITGICII